MSKHFNGTAQSTVVKAIFELWSSNPIIRSFFIISIVQLVNRIFDCKCDWSQLKMFVFLSKFNINFSLIIIIQVKWMQRKIKENQSHIRQRDSERYKKKIEWKSCEWNNLIVIEGSFFCQPKMLSAITGGLLFWFIAFVIDAFAFALPKRKDVLSNAQIKCSVVKMCRELAGICCWKEHIVQCSLNKSIWMCQHFCAVPYFYCKNVSLA